MSFDVSTIVFDFDGTLVSRDSFLDFAIRYCLRRPARLLLLVAVLPVATLLALGSSRRGLSALLWAMTLGVSPRRFVLDLRRYGAQTLPGYAHDSIFAELTRHVQAGRRVVIATGSVPTLVRGLFRARNLPCLPVVGSRFRSSFGGLVAETHCIGGVKVRELQRRLGIIEWWSVYTNSFADRSLIGRARDVTLVCPSERTLLLTRRLIDSSVALRVLRPS